MGHAPVGVGQVREGVGWLGDLAMPDEGTYSLAARGVQQEETPAIRVDLQPQSFQSSRHLA